MKKILKIFGVILILVFSALLIVVLKEKLFIKQKDVVNSSWTLTQFGSNEGGQMMSFTVEGDKEGLVIIDGGYKDNDEQYSFLMDKISKHNNVVDSWIITHFDSDHGGEFVRIANEEKDVRIKKVYVADTPTDMELLKENAPFEDEWEIYESYLKMDLPQKVKVHPKDKFSFIGLRMEVLCSYEDWIDEKTNNLLNNGAIVFKLYGNKESALFCGDVQESIIGEYLITNYKDKLKSDYLQVAHHGNNKLGDEFYKLVSPKIAFFPAPDWLMNNEGNVSWFTVGNNKELLESLGAKCLWHNTSPNIVNFK